ncbi:MAG TPA: hypothetical protein VFB25_01140 [Gaiellaceae bacterium]|nr:hypothetical protein [Gaiellaceae bacterium]
MRPTASSAGELNARIVVSVLTAVLLGTGVIETPWALSKLTADGTRARAVIPALRTDAPAFQTDIPRDYLAAAQATIPKHASYYVDQGPKYVSGNPLMAPSVKPVTAFELYPRRPLTEPQPGAWLICYGCDLDRWNGKASFSWEEGPLAIGRIEP